MKGTIIGWGRTILIGAWITLCGLTGATCSQAFPEGGMDSTQAILLYSLLGGNADSIGVSHGTSSISRGGTYRLSSSNRVNDTGPETFSIQNKGATRATIVNVLLRGANAEEFRLSLPELPLSIAAGSAHSFKLEFLPVTVDDKETEIVIEVGTKGSTHVFKVKQRYEAPTVSPGSPDLKVRIDSAAVAHSDKYDFDKVITNGCVASKNITLVNLGTDVLSVSGIVVSGDEKEDYTVTAPASAFLIHPGEANARTITVNFNPDGNGDREGRININSDDADEPSFEIKLEGEGKGGKPCP